MTDQRKSTAAEIAERLAQALEDIADNERRAGCGTSSFAGATAIAALAAYRSTPSPAQAEPPETTRLGPRKPFNRDTFDLVAFTNALWRAATARGKTMKEVSAETGVSETTLSRMKSSERAPDAASLAALSAWAGLNPANFCSAQAEPAASAGERDEAIRIWQKHCAPFASKLGDFPPSVVIDAMMEFARALPVEPATSNQKLLELADRIDHERLWAQPGLDRETWTAEQRDRRDAGVELRRYADLLGQDRWRIFPPRPGFCYSAKSLDAVVKMARKDAEA